MKETIERKNIIITKNIQNKEQLFHYLAEYMVSQKEIDAKHQEEFEQALWSREQLSVTGVGNDVAIPHVQKEFITRPIVVFLKSETAYSLSSKSPTYMSIFSILSFHTILRNATFVHQPLTF